MNHYLICARMKIVTILKVKTVTNVEEGLDKSGKCWGGV